MSAIEKREYQKIKEELGDVLLQVVLHSIIASENNHFSIKSVVESINAKMIRRHPHVFSGQSVESIEEVKKNWEKIKKEEKKFEGTPPQEQFSFDSGILSNTALLSANKIGEKTSKLNFDWSSEVPVLSKVEEELSELKNELKNDKRTKIKTNLEEEFGDLLFSMAQLGRHLGLNPELSLRKANEKFIRRFCQMEELASQMGKILIN